MQFYTHNLQVYRYCLIDKSFANTDIYNLLSNQKKAHKYNRMAFNK